MADEENKPNGDSSYNKMVEVHPPRVVKSDDDEDDGLDEHRGSLAKRTQLATKLSDFGIADKRLFPELEPSWLSYPMVSEIFPEEIVPLQNIITKHLLKEDAKLSVTEAMVKAKMAVSIGFSREGRLDEIHMYTSGAKAEEEENKNKGL